MRRWLPALLFTMLTGLFAVAQDTVTLMPAEYLGPGWDPVIAGNQNGDAMAIWREIIDRAPYNQTDLMMGVTTPLGDWAEARIIDADIEKRVPRNTTFAVESDGADTWIVAYTLTEQFTRFRSESNVYIRRTTDGGQTWSRAKRLRLQPLLPRIIATQPLIATDKAGNWMVAWADQTFGPTRGIWTAYSHNNGRTWTPARHVLKPRPRNQYFALALASGDGGWMLSVGRQDIAFDRDVVFVSEGGAAEIFRSCRHGILWESVWRREFAEDEAPVWLGGLASLGDGRWVGVLSEDASGERSAHVIRSVDAGETWSDPAVLTVSSQYASTYGPPTLAGDPHGNAVLAYTAYGNDGYAKPYVRLSSDAGENWSDPIRILTTDPAAWPAPCTGRNATDACIDQYDELYSVRSIDVAAAGEGSWRVVWRASPFTGTRGVEAGVHSTELLWGAPRTPAANPPTIPCADWKGSNSVGCGPTNTAPHTRTGDLFIILLAALALTWHAQAPQDTTHRPD